MFDECDDAAGHEPRRTDGLACARDFNHLDNSATRSDLDPTPCPRRAISWVREPSSAATTTSTRSPFMY
jgi:hypothetical protein